MERERPANDCVLWFMSKAVEHFLGGIGQDAEYFDIFAEAADKDWRKKKALPLLSELDAIALFGRVDRDFSLGLSLAIERLRNFPYDLHVDRAAEIISKGLFLGVGYRSRYIFGGEGDDLHVSAVSAANSAGIKIADLYFDREVFFSWDRIEKAIVSADSGFWVVSKNV